MSDLFASLDDEGSFCALVKGWYTETPKEISAVMHVEHVLSDERIKYAFQEYKQALQKFSIFLKSKNPDHYKRAGALLHALVAAKIITDVNLESSSAELDAGYTRVNAGDAQHMLKFVEFYENYFNESVAFQIAFRVCSAYEPKGRSIDLDYMHNMCRYLKCERENLTVDTCFMLFKSLMA